ncbi:MAG: hypothetical protein U9R38_00985 [Candidatus Margulisiibacteriota bacterium]|nr:hypothetical protein [Candidatus Margulisiibacteriota bacterium]
MRKLFITILTILLLFPLASSPAYSIAIKANHLQKKFTLISREKESGAERWRSTITGKTLKHEGETFIYLEAIGEEGNLKDESHKTWKSTSYSYLADGKIIPYSVKVKINNHQGEITDDIEIFYDRKNKKAICRINDKHEEFDINGNIADKQTFAIVMMAFPFKGKTMEKYSLLSYEPKLYQLEVRRRGIENINVNGREIECYKLEMVFNLGFLNIFDLFLPKFYLWYETAPPHYFVRYEGLENGLWTPYVLVEAIIHE